MKLSFWLKSACLLALLVVLPASSLYAREKTEKKEKLDYQPLPPAEYTVPTTAKPAEASPPTPGKEDEVKSGYKLGQGLTFKTADEKYLMRFSLRLQPRYQYIATEGPNRPNVNSFNLTRVRTIFSGNVINKDLKYFFQTEFFPAVVLRDAFIDYKVMNEFQVMFGQSFVPFCRELMSSTVKMQLISSSEAMVHFCPIRDIGVLFHGEATKWLNYDTFVMNGEGINASNFNKQMMFGGRVTAHVLGKKLPYQEGDLDRSTSPRLAVGAGLMYDTGFDKEKTTERANQILRSTLDMAFAYYGFYFQSAGYYLRNMTLKKQDLGFTTQAGYFIWPKKIELAARFGAIIPDRAGSALPLTGRAKASAVPIYETGGALNYFVFGGHEFKIQLDYTTLWNVEGTKNRNDNRIQIQAQVFF